jgi:hypothetical protein
MIGGAKQSLRTQVIYTMPKDQNFPSLRTKKVALAFGSVSRLFGHCAANLAARSGTLTVYENPPTETEYSSERLVTAATAAFGEGARRQWCSGVSVEFCWEWKLPVEKLSDGISFLSANEPLPKYYVGPAQFTVFYDFVWKDLKTGEPLPCQEPSYYTHKTLAASGLGVFLDRNSSVSFDARFPFEDVNSDFLSYLQNVIEFIPIRLPSKNFRLSIPNKAGTEAVWRKIAPEKLALIEQIVESRN